MLGVDIESKLSFKNNIKQICTKARAEIKALASIADFQDKGKTKPLINAF